MSAGEARERLKATAETRRALEQELAAVNEQLAAVDPREVSDLLDAEGYPRAHLDFATIKQHRELSNRRGELLREVQDLTEQLHRGLEDFHRLTAQQAGRPAP